MNIIKGITPQQLRRAADLRERILELESDLAELPDGPGGRTAPGLKSKRKRRSKPQRLTNIPQDVRKGWVSSDGRSGVWEFPDRPKQRKSAEARTRLAAGIKARWAAVKKAGRAIL